MSKVTVQAPANIAFIKYWGNTDDNLPLNNSISMTLDNCLTTTTVAFTDESYDTIEIQNQHGTYEELKRTSIKGSKAYEQIKRIRELAGSEKRVMVKSVNSFPANAGIASSASGFCALTAALLLVYGLKNQFEDKKELSKLVRMSGSGSAARSVMGGFVELIGGDAHHVSYAVQLADEKHWGLCDVIAIISSDSKKTPSSEGHRSAHSSPYFETRLHEMTKRIESTRKAIERKNIEKLGESIEQDTISMHAVMMTSNPPLYYWEPGTLDVIKHIISWREKDSLQAYFSIDAGANVHVICEKKDAQEIAKRLSTVSSVQSTIVNHPAKGVHEIENHLF